MRLEDLTREQANAMYEGVLKDLNIPSMIRLCKEDLFFLLTVVLNRQDVNRPWLFQRCREVALHPDGYLDLWFRAGYKSTIITYAKTIQDILINPEITVGIFSHTRPIAKSFLAQIKRELESNVLLKKLFSEVLYEEPSKEAPRWSLDSGIIVKRKGNPKESTVDAWGLVDGQPTSKHYDLMIYDDVVTRESVTTPDQINKTTAAWELSLNLASEKSRIRYIGTRYHFGDTWKTILDRGAAIPRIHPATDENGDSVLLDSTLLEAKRTQMGVYTYSCQMLQDPVADRSMGFQKDWLSFYDILKNSAEWNYYILVDPAGEKKKDSDYTVMLVIALGCDYNYYLIDGVRDRLNLTERASKLFYLHRKYRPLKVGYEKYGIQADIEHIKYVQQQEGYRFEIVPLGGQIPKEDRIRKLVPVFENHRFYLPHQLIFIDYENRARDLVQEFINDEFLAFPVSVHDDMLDCMARIVDDNLLAVFPEIVSIKNLHRENTYDKVETDYPLFP